MRSLYIIETAHLILSYKSEEERAATTADNDESSEVNPVGKLCTIEQEVGMIYEPEQPIAMTSINTNTVSEDQRLGGDALLDGGETATV